jgi:hypothetical protein
MRRLGQFVGWVSKPATFNFHDIRSGCANALTLGPP